MVDYAHTLVLVRPRHGVVAALGTIHITVQATEHAQGGRA